MKKTNKTPQEIYNLKTQLKFKKLSTIKRQGEILKKMKYEWGLRQLKNKGDYGFLTLEHFVQGEYVLTVKYKFTKIEKYLYEVEHFTYNETETSDKRKFYVLKNGRNYDKYDNLEYAICDMNFILSLEMIKKNNKRLNSSK